MEQLLKPMSPPLVAHRLRRVKENRSLLRSVRISFPVLTSLCLLHYVFLLGVSAGHQGRCQEDTGVVSARRGVGVRWTPGWVSGGHPVCDPDLAVRGLESLLESVVSGQ